MTDTMKERPILFSAPMVRAILEGRKTVTRRVVKPQPVYDRSYADDGLKICGKGKNKGSAASIHCTPLVCRFCPYGQPGDRLWVREAHSIHNAHGQHRVDGKRWGPWGGLTTRVSPDGTQIAYFREGFDRCDPGRWRPSIHMPRWASRITLELTAVRVERLQDITHEQAIAEGVHAVSIGSGYPDRYSATPVAWSDVVEDTAAAYEDARLAFRDLWDGINADRGFSWAANPLVWVVEFKRIEATA